jgi:hypothetical protein
MTDNLATTLDKALAQKIGELADLTAVDAALLTTLGLAS